MPLKKLKDTDTGTLGVWEISESEQELAENCPLTPDETLELSSIHHLTKRKEFLAGRLVLREVLRNRNISFQGIYKDSCGKPFLVNSGYHISLSHSFPFACAIINPESAVGIDIEKPQEKLLKISSRFLSPKEKLEVADNVQKHCIFWSAKEVLYKIYGRKKLIFNQELFVNLVPQVDGTLEGAIKTHQYHKSYRLKYFSFHEYIICYND